MDAAVFPPIERLLPHRGKAVWLERVVAWSAQEVSCEATLTSAFPYARGGRVVAVCGLELLAQAAAVYAALRTLSEGSDEDASAAPGYLVGVPEAEFSAALLPLGVPLTARVRPLWRQGGAARFSAELSAGQRPLVTAELSVYEPRRAPAAAEAG